MHSQRGLRAIVVAVVKKNLWSLATKEIEKLVNKKKFMSRDIKFLIRVLGDLDGSLKTVVKRKKGRVWGKR